MRSFRDIPGIIRIKAEFNAPVFVLYRIQVLFEGNFREKAGIKQRLVSSLLFYDDNIMLVTTLTVKFLHEIFNIPLNRHAYLAVWADRDLLPNSVTSINI